MPLFPALSGITRAVAVVALTAIPAVAETPIQLAALNSIDWPASSGEADAFLSAMFNPGLLAAADASELAAWAAYVIPGQATRTALDNAGPEGIDVVLAGLIEGGRGAEVVAQHDAASAAPLFAVLFHPAVIDAVARSGGPREAAWSGMVDELEALYHLSR